MTHLKNFFVAFVWLFATLIAGWFLGSLIGAFLVWDLRFMTLPDQFLRFGILYSSVGGVIHLFMQKFKMEKGTKNESN